MVHVMVLNLIMQHLHCISASGKNSSLSLPFFFFFGLIFSSSFFFLEKESIFNKGDGDSSYKRWPYVFV